MVRLADIFGGVIACTAIVHVASVAGVHIGAAEGVKDIGGGASLVKDERLESSPAVNINSPQASDSSVTRFIFCGLRDVSLADCQLCYFLRDNSKDRSKIARYESVRMSSLNAKPDTELRRG